jgi:transcriptional regulator with XRE-family HTH domain
MTSIPPRRTPKHTPVLVKDSLERFGQRLVIARKLREMTQEQLASLSDVSPSTLRSLEEGADGVSIGNVLKVLQGLNLMDQVDDLLDLRRDPEATHFAERQLGR